MFFFFYCLKRKKSEKIEKHPKPAKKVFQPAFGCPRTQKLGAGTQQVYNRDGDQNFVT